MVPEHSLVVRDVIGEVANDTLMCVTDYMECCVDHTPQCRLPYNLVCPESIDPILHVPPGPGWVIPSGRKYYKGSFFTSASDQVVRLHRSAGSDYGVEGIFSCRILVGPGDLQDLYVGIYGHTDPDGDG